MQTVESLPGAQSPPLEPSDKDVDETKTRMTDLNNAIKEAIGDYRNAGVEGKPQIPSLSEDDLVAQLNYCMGLEPHELVTNKQQHYFDEDIPDVDDAPTQDVESASFDKFLGIYVELPSSDGSSKVLGRVLSRKRDSDGAPVGNSNDNPLLSTAIYNIQTPDGHIAEYTANVIAENLWAQVDDVGTTTTYYMR